MHSIKKAAHSEAWRRGSDSGRNLNPFARGSSFKGNYPNDEESALRSIRQPGIQEDRTIDNQHHDLQRDRSGHGPDDINAHQSGSQDRGLIDNESHLDSHHNGKHHAAHGDHAKKDGHDVKDVTNGHHQGHNAERDATGLSNETTPTEHGGKLTLRNRFAEKFHLNSLKSVGSDGELKRKKKRKHIPAMQQFKEVMLGSWINVLLIAVPVSFALNYAHLNGVAIFCVAFAAIIPLASTLSFATEQLAMYSGETLGGLLNASFGNATELIVSIFALADGKIVIVQTSLIGSMLSNLLLVLGMCFFFGGINRVKQHFNVTVAQTAASLLALATGSLLIPTAFVRFGSSTDNDLTQAGVGPISRGTSVILLLVYASYLLFQLKTHTDMYNAKSEKGEKRASSKKEKGDIFKSMAQMGGAHAGATVGKKNQENYYHEEEEEEEAPVLSVVGALVTLLISTVIIAFCSEFLVTGIDSVAGSISQEFIGLILLPIVGNAAEHATAVTVAVKDKMDLAIGVAVGSSMQIALLVLPLMVIIGWCGLGHGKGPDPTATMDLDFDGFQIAVLFISVLLVNYLIQDGESHWLEGVLLMATYIIIATAAFFYPVMGSLTG